MEVITLKVDPGGCGAEYPSPASASTDPLRASSTAAPPYRLPSASTVVCWSSGSIVVRTALPRTGSVVASTRPPPISLSSAALTASSWPPGRPARRSLKASSSPEIPVRVSGGKPAIASSRPCSGSGSPTSPTTARAAVLTDRAAAGPSASGVLSAARIGARGGARVRRLSSSPSSSAG